MTNTVLLILAGCVVALFLPYFNLWLQGASTGTGIGLLRILGMRLHGVRPRPIVMAMIAAKQTELELDIDDLETHARQGGDVTAVVKKMIQDRSLGFADAAAEVRRNEKA